MYVMASQLIQLPQLIYKDWECFIERIVHKNTLSPNRLQLLSTEYAS
jgi:hypothetical protein